MNNFKDTPQLFAKETKMGANVHGGFISFSKPLPTRC